MDVLLRFDGGCTRNGYPDARGTFAWQVFDADNRLIGEGSGTCAGQQLQTNNVAEYVALIEGLQWLRRLGHPITELVIEGDSQFVLKTVHGEWGCKKPHLRRLRGQARWVLSQLDSAWSVRWIPRAENATCDRLAARARTGFIN